MKGEATDYLELETIKNLVRKYSQFINFPIYVWSSKTETVEEPIDETDADKKDEDHDEVEVEEEDKLKKVKHCFKDQLLSVAAIDPIEANLNGSESQWKCIFPF